MGFQELDKFVIMSREIFCCAPCGQIVLITNCQTNKPATKTQIRLANAATLTLENKLLKNITCNVIQPWTSQRVRVKQYYQ